MGAIAAYAAVKVVEKISESISESKDEKKMVMAGGNDPEEIKKEEPEA